MSIIRKEQLSNPLSASYAETASFALNANVTINTSSLVTTSSFNAFTASINNFTSSYNTGSFSGSFTGSLNGTASFASTASYVNPLRQNVQITGSLLVSNSIDSSLRELYDSSGTGSISWGSRQLNDNLGSIITDYSNPIITQHFAYSNITYTGSKLERFSSTFNYAGVVLRGVSIDVDASLYDLVNLSGGTWTTNRNDKNGSILKLGIVVINNNDNTGDVLLEGDIVVNDNDNSVGPYVIGITTTGEPIYMADFSIVGAGRMSETAPDNGYLRTLGHLYYNNINTNTNLYIMRFNPSNDYYRLI
jgi:hypothetical protein